LRFAAQGPNSRRVPFLEKRFLMNRYPVWKYTIIVIVLLVGLIYALPNFFGESPAVQVSAAKSTVKIDGSTQARVEEVLKDGRSHARPADAGADRRARALRHHGRPDQGARRAAAGAGARTRTKPPTWWR
jgi:hypothetical protein